MLLGTQGVINIGTVLSVKAFQTLLASRLALLIFPSIAVAILTAVRLGLLVLSRKIVQFRWLGIRFSQFISRTANATGKVLEYPTASTLVLFVTLLLFVLFDDLQAFLMLIFSLTIFVIAPWHMILEWVQPDRSIVARHRMPYKGGLFDVKQWNTFATATGLLFAAWLVGVGNFETVKNSGLVLRVGEEDDRKLTAIAASGEGILLVSPESLSGEEDNWFFLNRAGLLLHLSD